MRQQPVCRTGEDVTHLFDRQSHQVFLHIKRVTFLMSSTADLTSMFDKHVTTEMNLTGSLRMFTVAGFNVTPP